MVRMVLVCVSPGGGSRSCAVVGMVLVCIPRGRECCGGDGVGVYPQR